LLRVGRREAEQALGAELLQEYVYPSVAVVRWLAPTERAVLEVADRVGLGERQRGRAGVWGVCAAPNRVDAEVRVAQRGELGDGVPLVHGRVGVRRA
jgi:hypothetical protein